MNVPNLERKLLKQIPLSDRIKEIILGSVLGDGCLVITKRSKNAIFAFRHGMEQEEYFMWKVNEFSEISNPKFSYWRPADGFSKNKKLYFSTRRLESLTSICLSLKKNGKFDVKRKWLNHLTPLSLAVWWCDDGSIVSNHQKAVFCTDGFSENSIKVLAKYLEIVWKVKGLIWPVKRVWNKQEKIYYRIWLSNVETRKFLRIIIPYIPVKSMIRKVLLIYKDSKFQQRWISEIKALINSQLIHFVDSEMELKLGKLSALREDKLREKLQKKI
jgi:hypothetical protein